MSRRGRIITLSVVACVFGALFLFGPADHRAVFYGLNIACSVIASVLASLDLRRRGYGWGWAMLAAYLAPLVGTILYVVFSGQRDYAGQAQNV
jgi:uncharacterized membrane protein HdeD (DUF308 family)